MTSGMGPSLLSLPDEIFLKILSRLPLAELVNALPFVCKGFCGLLRLPRFLFGLRFLELSGILADKPTPVDVGALCNWLQPRLRQLLEFKLLLGLTVVPADRPLISQLCDSLPTSWTTLALHLPWTDTGHEIQQSQPRGPCSHVALPVGPSQIPCPLYAIISFISSPASCNPR